MELGALGEPMWKQGAGKWLNRRSKDAKVCVTDLIDHMITESKKIYAGTDMEEGTSLGPLVCGANKTSALLCWSDLISLIGVVLSAWAAAFAP